MDLKKKIIFILTIILIIVLGAIFINYNIEFSKKFILKSIKDKVKTISELNKFIIKERINDLKNKLYDLTDGFKLDINLKKIKKNKDYQLKMQLILDKKFKNIISDPRIRAILIFDKNGDCLYSSVFKKQVLNKNYSFRPYFQDIIWHHKNMSLYFLQGTVTKKMGFFFSHKIIDREGNIGVLVVKLYPNILKSILYVQYKNKQLVKLSAISNEQGVLFVGEDKFYALEDISFDLAQKIRKYKIVLNVNKLVSFGFPKNTWEILKTQHFLDVYNPVFNKRYILVLKKLPFNKYYLFLIQKNVLFSDYNEFSFISKIALIVYVFMLTFIIFLYLSLARESKKNIRLYERHNTIVEQSKNIIFSTNVFGHLIYFNKYAKRYFSKLGIEIKENMKIEEVLGQGIRHVFSKSCRNVIFEKSFRDREGTEKWVHFSLSPIMDADGKIVEWIIMGFDVSKQKKIEQELKKASAAKTTFLSVMSHEIRTPMNAIFGMAELLAKSEAIRGEERKLARSIYKSAAVLLALLNEFLDLSKIEAGKMELDANPFVLHEVLKQNVYIFRQLAVDRGLGFYCYLDPKVPFKLFGDAKKLGQIIRNLLSNAFKFTSNGYVKLSCEVTKIKDKQAWILFKVQDTGLGVSKENLKTIFDKFTQEDGSIDRNFGGTGLGLALCKEFVELMGGKIWVESDKGIGSTFYVELPLEIVEAEPKDMDQYLDWLQDKTVVVLDPDSLPRDILHKEFRFYNIKVKEMTSEDELFSYLKDESPERDKIILIIDEAYEYILSHDLLRGYPIILQTYSSSIKGHEYDNVKIAEKPICKYTFMKIYQFFVEKSQKDASKKDEGSLGLKGKVLVVEDNPMNQLLVESVLKKYDVDIKIASDGVEALKSLAEEDFVLVFMDVQMPNLDGVRVTQIIRSLEQGEKLELVDDVRNLLAPNVWEQLSVKLKGKHIPIVAMTANVFEHEQKSYLESGMDDVLPKPFTLKQLELVLKKYA
ncbi:MAG: ATP-binding protein [Desulfonauticus sp.]|nr:ATP-binding protein [Desulfonauticus sp.]